MGDRSFRGARRSRWVLKKVLTSGLRHKRTLALERNADGGGVKGRAGHNSISVFRHKCQDFFFGREAIPIEIDR